MLNPIVGSSAVNPNRSSLMHFLIRDKELISPVGAIEVFRLSLVFQ